MVMKTKVAPTAKARFQNLRVQILSLVEDLQKSGYSLPPPSPISLIASPVKDLRTEAFIGHVQEPLGVYLQRVSVRDNEVQRPPFDHMEDPIYRKLTRDFLAGAEMPESKVAALDPEADDQRATNLDVPNIRYSVIDGLQRLYCFSIAVLVALYKEQLVEDGSISNKSWEYLNAGINELPTVEELLQRDIRYEIFYGIDLEGLLHYMVTYNTGQRRMSLNVQLEIMQRPLIDQFENAGIPIYHDINRLPRDAKPQDKFAASEIVLAAQAFLTFNPQTTSAKEADRFLSKDDRYLDDVGDIADMVSAFTRIANKIHPVLIDAYQGNPRSQYILSQGGIFLIGLAAACGYIRAKVNAKALEGILDKLENETSLSTNPLNLEEYHETVQRITTSRGKFTRRLVYDTFLRFFNGSTLNLEWDDTMNQILGT